MRMPSLPSLRTRRATFWLLAPDRLVAAVFSRSEDEPLLEACAASYARAAAGFCFAPGIAEVAAALGVEKQAHVAALGASFCRLRETAASPAAAATEAGRPRRADSEQEEERVVAVLGREGLAVHAESRAVLQAAHLFRRSGLHLLALDCEPCAMASLAEFLGTDPGAANAPELVLDSAPLTGAFAENPTRRQALSAVSVRPEAERAAEALGEDLAVPVGLAVAWFGALRAL